MIKFLKTIALVLVFQNLFSQTFRQGFDIHNVGGLSNGQGEIMGGNNLPSSYLTNIGAYLINSENEILESYINMYKATEDIKYLDLFVIHAKRIKERRDDNLPIINIDNSLDTNYSKFQIGIGANLNFTLRHSYFRYSTEKTTNKIGYGSQVSAYYFFRKHFAFFSKLFFNTHNYDYSRSDEYGLNISYQREIKYNQIGLSLGVRSTIKRFVFAPFINISNVTNSYEKYMIIDNGNIRLNSKVNSYFDNNISLMYGAELGYIFFLSKPINVMPSFGYQRYIIPIYQTAKVYDNGVLINQTRYSFYFSNPYLSLSVLYSF